MPKVLVCRSICISSNRLKGLAKIFRSASLSVYSKAEQRRLRDTSDRLCREYGLSVIEHSRKAPSRPVWLDEQSGKPTRYNVYRADVRDAVNGSRTVEMMEKYGWKFYLLPAIIGRAAATH